MIPLIFHKIAPTKKKKGGKIEMKGAIRNEGIQKRIIERS